MAIKCQLAIQGGGAKLVALLAAMEAVQNLQDEGRIQVTRVAGTSAGAIVAALFAAETDLAAARTRLVRTFGNDVARFFPPPTIMKLVRTTWWSGKPLWNETDLRPILEPLFSEANVYALGDLLQKRHRVKVHILAS